MAPHGLIGVRGFPARSYCNDYVLGGLREFGIGSGGLPGGLLRAFFVNFVAHFLIVRAPPMPPTPFFEEWWLGMLAGSGWPEC